MVASSHARYVSIPSSSSTPSSTSTAVLSSPPLGFDQPYSLTEKSSSARGYADRRPTLPSHHSFTAGGGGRQTSWKDVVVGLIRRSRNVLLICTCLVLAWLLLSSTQLEGTRVSKVLDKVRHPLTPTTPTGAASSIVDEITPAEVTPIVEAPYRLEDDIVLITKVGSATVHKRLLIHLAEQPHSNVYAPNRLYVSDYPMVLGNITFFDALSNVSSTISLLDEFAALRGELHALLESNQDLELMSDKDGGWKLDKYKFLPMMGEAWRRFPDKKWYVMVEADTFLFWNEMVKWLSGLDENEQYMLGRPMFCDFEDRKSTPFMHGGSGFVLSRAVMQASYGQDADFEHHHDALTQEAAFGDALLTKALYDAPLVNLTELSPESGERFNTDTPRSIKFNHGMWCEPVLSFHHVTPADTAHLYAFQRRIEPKLSTNDTVRWADIWDEFIPAFLKRGLAETASSDPTVTLASTDVIPGEVGVVGWQALEDSDDASDVQILSAKNALDCQAHCRLNHACLMWEFRTKSDMGQCKLALGFLRIGVTKPRTEDGLTTGWMGARIDQLRSAKDCSGRTGLNSYEPAGGRKTLPEDQDGPDERVEDEETQQDSAQSD